LATHNTTKPKATTNNNTEKNKQRKQARTQQQPTNKNNVQTIFIKHITLKGIAISTLNPERF
jgi:hypothetical protein